MLSIFCVIEIEEVVVVKLLQASKVARPHPQTQVQIPMPLSFADLRSQSLLKFIFYCITSSQFHFYIHIFVTKTKYYV